MSPSPQFRIGVQLFSEAVVDSARAIEAAGFDYLSSPDHLMFHGPTPSALISLAAAAAITRSIGLLSSVIVAPLYQPAVLAKHLASLDVLSGGRLNLGVGVGGEFPKEFGAAGVPIAERALRLTEALEVLLRLWPGESTSFEGRYVKFTDVQLSPRPIQQPRPKIWLGGRTEAAMKRAARFADYWIPYMYSPERLRSSINIVRNHTEQLGRDPDEVTPAIYAFASVAEDSRRAREMAVKSVGETYQQDSTSIIDRFGVVGSPAECCARLNEYRDAGAQVAILALACPTDQASSMLRVVASEILPEFRPRQAIRSLAP